MAGYYPPRPPLPPEHYGKKYENNYKKRKDDFYSEGKNVPLILTLAVVLLFWLSIGYILYVR